MIDLDLPPPPSDKIPCNSDYLTFSEADINPIIRCGSDKNTAFTSYGNEMFIQFVTDNQVTSHKGFNLTYTGKKFFINTCTGFIKKNIEPISYS